jgi:hypothetical protein
MRLLDQEYFIQFVAVKALNFIKHSIFHVHIRMRALYPKKPDMKDKYGTVPNLIFTSVFFHSSGLRPRLGQYLCLAFLEVRKKGL